MKKGNTFFKIKNTPIASADHIYRMFLKSISFVINCFINIMIKLESSFLISVYFKS